MPIRDINLLDPVVAVKAKQLEAGVKKDLGINIRIIETIRTLDIQRAYYAQGRNELALVNGLRQVAGLWPIGLSQNQRRVTWTLDSIHLYECAFDFAIIKRGQAIWNTKADLNDNDYPDYEEVGRYAEGLGLTWGGRFKNRDMTHCQFTDGLTLSDLRKGKRPSDNKT
jgi:hypothetical protein